MYFYLRLVNFALRAKAPEKWTQIFHAIFKNKLEAAGGASVYPTQIVCTYMIFSI